MKNHIQIIDWAGNILFEGHYNDPEADKVLDVNRCNCEEGCDKCDHTGYAGDFSINWLDQDDERNVYEYINY